MTPTTGQQAIRELDRAATDRAGNLLSMPGVFPDYPAPIVRNGTDGRELAEHAISSASTAAH